MSFLPAGYIGVHTRVQQFHDKYNHGSIETESAMIGDKTVKFKAKVTIVDVENGAPFTRTFTGQSFINIDKDKAFEKGETVAVGRALAFAGFEIKSGIASEDEMQKFDAAPTTAPKTEVACNVCKGPTKFKSFTSKAGKLIEGFDCLSCKNDKNYPLFQFA